MCGGGCTPTLVFSWLGALLVNTAFISIISWSAASLWPLGFVLCVGYTAFLIFLGVWLRKKVASESLSIGTDELTVASDLLLLLACFGVGAAGLFLPVNLLGCGDGSGSSQDGASWSTDTSSMSPAVAAWANDVSWYSQASFAHLSGGTVFRGSNGTQDVLWISSDAAAPPRLVSGAGTYPRSVVAVDDARACFVADEVTTSGVSSSAVFCTDGGDATPLWDGSFEARPLYPRSLLPDGSQLWFKADAPFGYASTGVVWRGEPAAGTATLVSAATGASPAPPPSAEAQEAGSGAGEASADSCDPTRPIAIGVLFLSALPLLGTSAVFFWKLRLSSAPFGLFSGASASVLTIMAAIDASGSIAADFVKWWFTVFSFLWLVVVVLLRLTRRLAADGATLTWAVNVGAIGYFAALHAQTGVPIDDDWWRWLVYNVACVLPLGALGVVVARGVPLVLFAAGVFIDTWRLSSALADLAADGTAQVLIRFVTLGVTGVAVVGGGVLYSREQAALAARVEAVATRLLPVRLAGAGSQEEGNGDGDKREVVARL